MASRHSHQRRQRRWSQSSQSAGSIAWWVSCSSRAAECAVPPSVCMWGSSLCVSTAHRQSKSKGVVRVLHAQQAMAVGWA